MAKDPRFNFYVDNWIGGTKRMTLEQKGAYIELLVLNFYCLSDGLPGFTEKEAINAVASSAGYAQIWGFLKSKFPQAGEYYCNERMAKEFAKSKLYSEKQALRSKKRWGSDAVASSAGYALNGTGNGIETVKEDFIKAVNAFSEYKPEMLAAFLRYWTEMNPSRTQMKFQMQKTFEIKLRLITWARNEIKFGKNPKNEVSSTTLTTPMKNTYLES